MSQYVDDELMLKRQRACDEIRKKQTREDAVKQRREVEECISYLSEANLSSDQRYCVNVIVGALRAEDETIETQTDKDVQSLAECHFNE